MGQVLAGGKAPRCLAKRGKERGKRGPCGFPPFPILAASGAMAGAALPVASSGIDGADIPLLNCDGGDLKGAAMGFCLSWGEGGDS